MPTSSPAKNGNSESGLDEFGARYYGSSLGRFMTPDWAANPTDVPYADFGDPQSLNLYGYVRNNPLSHADADGHCCDDEIDYGVGVLRGIASSVSFGYFGAPRPSRGPDTGKDLVAAEVRRGKLGESTIKYLVSCKHKAFSGKGVSPSDEQDIDDRIKSNGCNGFLGVYSTIATSGLGEKLRKLGFEYQIFDNTRIEREILGTPEGLALAKQYFPLSIQQWITENPSPVLISGELQHIECEIYRRDLLGKIKPPTFLGGVLGYCTRGDGTNDYVRPDHGAWTVFGVHIPSRYVLTPSNFQGVRR